MKPAMTFVKPLRPEELPPTMFYPIRMTLSPFFRNSAAALTPLKPPPTMSSTCLTGTPPTALHEIGGATSLSIAA